MPRAAIPTWTESAFIGGAFCLDFANTQGGPAKQRDVERLPEAASAVAWAAAAGVLTPSEATIAAAHCAGQPQAARAALRELHELREALYAVFSWLGRGDDAPPAAAATLAEHVARALRSARLLRQSSGVEWTIVTQRPRLATVTARVALCAQRLLASEAATRVRECDRCTWLFIDRTRNHARRWCKAETCGNRARVARHQQATRAAGRDG